MNLPRRQVGDGCDGGKKNLWRWDEDQSSYVATLRMKRGWICGKKWRPVSEE